jgi:hypothetical protein
MAYSHRYVDFPSSEGNDSCTDIVRLDRCSDEIDYVRLVPLV